MMATPRTGPTKEMLDVEIRANPTQAEAVALRLREMVLSGTFRPGQRLAEIPVAQLLGVSRTPVRLAFNILEREGLLTGAARRGFTVRRFTIEEVSDAIDVRGTLEGMACRLAIERGLDDETRAELSTCIVRADAILGKGRFDATDTREWSALNARFHGVIVKAARNHALAEAIGINARIPLASAAALVFNTTLPDLGFGQLQEAHREHRTIFQALVRGEAARAENLMREHAYRSRETKRANFEDMKARRIGTEIPGVRLVVG